MCVSRREISLNALDILLKLLLFYAGYKSEMEMKENNSILVHKDNMLTIKKIQVRSLEIYIFYFL